VGGKGDGQPPHVAIEGERDSPYIFRQEDFFNLFVHALEISSKDGGAPVCSFILSSLSSQQCYLSFPLFCHYSNSEADSRPAAKWTLVFLSRTIARLSTSTGELSNSFALVPLPCCTRRERQTATTGRLPKIYTKKKTGIPAAERFHSANRFHLDEFEKGEKRKNPALTPVNFRKMIAARGSVALLIALMLSSAFSQELWSQTRVKRDKGGHHHQVGWPLSFSFFSLPRHPPEKNNFTSASENRNFRHQCDDCQLTLNP